MEACLKDGRIVGRKVQLKRYEVCNSIVEFRLSTRETRFQLISFESSA